jgi:O-antigen/teichoic acid export membrane protein
LNIIVGAVLIPIWGVEGAAVALLASIAARNVLVSLLARRKLGLGTTIFG